jgi:hypothetical protein
MVKSLVRGLCVAAVVCGGGILGTQMIPQSSHASGNAVEAPQSLVMYVMPGRTVAKGVNYNVVDGKLHDSIVPSVIVAKVGVPLKVTVYNYDDGAHSITSPSLGLNIVLVGGTIIKGSVVRDPAGALGLGEPNNPGVTTFTLNVAKPGTYYWYCALPCDGQNKHTAMTSGPNGNGKGQIGTMGGYIVVV